MAREDNTTAPDDAAFPQRRASLTRYGMFVGGILTVFLVSFVVAGAVAVAVLDDPTPWLATAEPLTAVLGLALLVADVVLPVPSSLIMIAHGALFGVGIGAALSLAGSIGATLVGYAIGRSAGAPLLHVICTEAEHTRADRLLRRWGFLAIAASRPLPLLAETVAVAAGTSSIGIGRTLLAATIGAAPGAILYAAAGAAGLSTANDLLVFGAVLLVTAILWFVGSRAAAHGRVRPTSDPSGLAP